MHSPKPQKHMSLGREGRKNVNTPMVLVALVFFWMSVCRLSRSMMMARSDNMQPSHSRGRGLQFRDGMSTFKASVMVQVFGPEEMSGVVRSEERMWKSDQDRNQEGKGGC